MRLQTLAALAVFVFISSAQGASFAWFETPNTGGNFPGGAGGFQGSTLHLLCDVSQSAGVCTWQIAMKAALGPGGIYAWSLDLRTAPGNGLSITSPQIQPGTPFNNPAFPGTPGSGPSLLTFAAGQTFSPVTPQTLTLMTFTLRQNFNQGDFSFKTIFGGPSANDSIVWANASTGDYEVVGFGPNPPAPAFEGTVGALPLIFIGDPEPASLSLLVLGAPVVLRRRQ